MRSPEGGRALLGAEIDLLRRVVADLGRRSTATIAPGSVHWPPAIQRSVKAGTMHRLRALRACASHSLAPLQPVALGCAALLLTAGCGLIGSLGGSSPSPGLGAFNSCLRQHGISFPTPGPTSGSGLMAGGGYPGGNAPAFTKALKACASLLPHGGAVTFQAFRRCMSSHGETITSALPTAPPTSSADGLFGLNPGDPRAEAALNACQDKLPSSISFGVGGLVSASASP